MQNVTVQLNAGKTNKEVTVVIMQPYFLPYRNYFGLIGKADHFVIFDDVQFCRKWQQRNNILSKDGSKKWLTVPIISSRPHTQLIKDVKLVDDDKWKYKIITKVMQAYEDHPYFELLFPEFRNLLMHRYGRLLDLNVELLKWATRTAGIKEPKWYFSSRMANNNTSRMGRLLDICKLLGATTYLVGTAAKAYFDEKMFHDAGIGVQWHEVAYPEYPQMNTERFDHFVSIIDLLMNCGRDSSVYMECNDDSI